MLKRVQNRSAVRDQTHKDGSHGNRQRRRIAGGLMLSAVAITMSGGCEKLGRKPAPKMSSDPIVRVVRPARHAVVKTIGQPGLMEAAEQTSLVTKVPGFVAKWHADIGDKVKAGQVLAELSVPELVEERNQKKAQVELDAVMVEQAGKLIKVAEQNLQTALSQITEANANVAKSQADIDRWQSELKRLTKMVEDRVVDRQVFEETQRQWKASMSMRDVALSKLKSEQSHRLAAEATLEKTRVDVRAAEAKVKVSQAEERRLAAMLAYTKIVAPYDGVIIARNVNTGDFVRPAGGESGGSGSGESQGRAGPLYIVARIDRMRVVVGIPEMESFYVKVGSRAKVRVQALQGREMDATVARTSRALNARSRTLMAEIELPNLDGTLLPGMYVYGSVLIERPESFTVPESAVVQLGNQHCCFLFDQGKAIKTPVQIGVSDGHVVEIAGFHRGGGSPLTEWTPVIGNEMVVDGNLVELVDGQKVVLQSSE